MANPSRATVTVDGTKFNAITASVQFTTEKDHAGVAKMGSLKTSIRVWVDAHDSTNLPFSTIQMLFNMANLVTNDKIKPIKIEYWQDDSQQNALVGYSFSGWIQHFQFSNPIDFLPGVQVDPTLAADAHSTAAMLADGVPAGVNHLLLLELQPSLNQTHFPNVQVTN